MNISSIKNIAFFFAIPLFFSCSGGSNFEIDGHLLNMNQGTLYVYSSTGLIHNIDTIQIEGGRFTYSRSIDKEGIFVLVFPNFSEIPVFAEPGEDAVIKGNAQQLNEITISGTEDNHMMNSFRKDSYDKAPPQVQQMAEGFINNYSESMMCIWLLDKYFIKTINPDYGKIIKLAKVIKEAQPENQNIMRIIMEMEYLAKATKSKKLPSFSFKDVQGKIVNNESLKGKKSIIYTAATWDYNNDLERNIKQYIQNEKYDFHGLKINLDPAKRIAKQELEWSNLDIKIICQENMFNSEAMKKFGFFNLGDNIVVDAQGNIIARNIKPSDVESKMK